MNSMSWMHRKASVEIQEFVFNFIHANNLLNIEHKQQKTTKKCDTFNFKSRVNENQLFFYSCVIKTFKHFKQWTISRYFYPNSNAHVITLLFELIKRVAHRFHYQNEKSTIKSDDTDHIVWTKGLKCYIIIFDVKSFIKVCSKSWFFLIFTRQIIRHLKKIICSEIISHAVVEYLLVSLKCVLMFISLVNISTDLVL